MGAILAAEPAVGPGWWIVVLGAGVLAWSVLLDLRFHTGDRLARWWVPRAKGQGPWAGPVAFLASAVALAGYVLVALVGWAVASATSEDRWALTVVVPAMLVYAPVVFETMPSRVSGYRHWREALAKAGADARLQRTIAWGAGPPSTLGLVLMIVTLFPIFD